MKAQRNPEVGIRHSGATTMGVACAGGTSEERGRLLEGKDVLKDAVAFSKPP